MAFYIRAQRGAGLLLRPPRNGLTRCTATGRVMNAAGAMLFGRGTHELMEDAWPQVARDPKATPSNRDWARKLEAKPKYVVSTTRRNFPWNNSHHVEGDLTRAVKEVHAARTAGG